MTPEEQKLNEQHDKDAAANKAAMAPVASPFKPAVNPPVFKDASLPDQAPGGGPFRPGPINPMPFAVHEAAAGPHPAETHLAQQAPGTPVVGQYPKTLSNPDRRRSLEDDFTVSQEDGRFAAPDVVVQDPTEEQAARKRGFTVAAVTVEPCPKCGSIHHHPEIVIDLCSNCGNKFQVNRKEGQTIRWVTT